VPRLAGEQREAETCCLYNDERSQEADRERVDSSGLKNWPTAMTAEGGGIPEIGCNMPINKFTTRQVHQFSHVVSKNHISLQIYRNGTAHSYTPPEGDSCCSKVRGTQKTREHTIVPTWIWPTSRYIKEKWEHGSNTKLQHYFHFPKHIYHILWNLKVCNLHLKTRRILEGTITGVSYTWWVVTETVK
jgi:hypothetical protein